MRILYQNLTDYHDVTIYDTTDFDGEKGRFRVMQFSEAAVQGVYDRNDPAHILFEYPRAMIHLMCENNASFTHVYMIGYGIGALPRHFSNKQFKVAELDGKLVEISRRYFATDSADVHIGDGRRLLEEEPSGKYSYIVVDAFTAEGTPPHLSTLQFYRLTRDKLAEEGMLLINLIAEKAQDKRVCAAYATLREVYPETQSFALPVKGAAGLLNILLVGGAKHIQYQQLKMAGFREITLVQGELLVDNVD